MEDIIEEVGKTTVTIKLMKKANDTHNKSTCSSP